MVKLDIGCGTPEQKKPGYFGIDVNPDYNPDKLWNCDNGIPYNYDSVDAIWMDNSLEHFVNPSYVLKESNRVLKEGGIIEIALPNLQYFPVMVAMFFGDIQKMWNKWMNSKYKTGRSQHWTLWTPEVLRLQLEHYGFEIIEERGWLYGKTFYMKARKKSKKYILNKHCKIQSHSQPSIEASVKGLRANEGASQSGVLTGELETCEDYDIIKGSPQKKHAPCKGDLCPDCGGLIKIRNPTGKCDHLYYPEYKTSQSSTIYMKARKK